MNRLSFAITALLILSAPAVGQIAVSAHDGKQIRPDDIVNVMTPDEVMIIDLGHYPPRPLAIVDAPASMIGPPGAVAVSPDEKFALVTGAQHVDAADASKLVPADIVSLIDISDPAKARVKLVAQAGLGASGVAISPNGRLALVTSNQDHSVTIFAVGPGKLDAIGRLQFPDGSGPCDAAFAPDGKSALIVRRGDSRITILKVDGQKVTNSGVDITPGRGPYQVAISPDGRFAFTNNLAGAATRAELDAPRPAAAPGENEPRRPGTISAIDIAGRKVVTSIEVGQTPETVVLSPDGKLLAVVVANGASVQRNAPNYAAVHGILRLFRVDGGQLTQLAAIDNGHWCQGAAFSNNGATLLVQCGSERAIEVYRINGDTIARDPQTTIPTRSRGGSITTGSVR